MNATRYNLLPASCCIFFGEEDAAALEWMNKQLSPEANILIAASEAVVFENTSLPQYAGSDAGIWVTPLIHRKSTLLRYDTDFSQKEIHNQLCKTGITHLYAGGMGTNFNHDLLKSLPSWYEILVDLPKTQVYKLVSCPSPSP
jgi:hypothetical protein